MESLWATAGETAALNLPNEPNAKLSAEEVICAIIRGLQYNNVPSENAGLIRCYNFMDLPCKKLVTGYGNVPEERTLEMFLKHAAESPKLKPFMNANSIEFGPHSSILGTPTRGEIVSMPMRVCVAEDPFQYDSGITRNGLGLESPKRTFMIRLQKQRRPPLPGAYLVTDIIDVATVASISRPLNRE